MDLAQYVFTGSTGKENNVYNACMHDNTNMNETAAGAELDSKSLLNRYILRVCMDDGMDFAVRMSKGALQFQNVGTIRRRTLLPKNLCF